ncbi:prolyl oligopeptidase family serine peptidase [Luteimonas sp. M1R5S18]|uniref:Prolyl oligopeptidase family serine peptidase n=1 Tax=Luteimonas rhizosphaericola TaxID=3042024 RepID=A0ABT6JKF3_9GAMM|nr:prolyl oligopeptidase family serine peptidase [Luteimonas rhizosphaericola]MDH5831153.1 prolyl oligopeptidase family serine peptidase [Luteimonas rhizosphaericola]
MRIPFGLALVMATLVAGCTSAPERPERGEFVERELRMDGQVHRYQVFVPARAAAAGKAPVILFLHGSGERGADNQRQVAVGLGPQVRRQADTFPAIVVFPQVPEDGEWNQVVDVTFAQLDAATREFGGDPDRTYLTGLSMGGYGAWELALRQSYRFAAVVPVCGGLVHPRRTTMAVTVVADEADPYAAVAQRLHGMPVWMFHGAKDDLVPPEYSRRLEAAFRAAGARDARYTEFPDANHNSWDPAYATPELWDWLFAQRRTNAFRQQ